MSYIQNEQNTKATNKESIDIKIISKTRFFKLTKKNDHETFLFHLKQDIEKRLTSLCIIATSRILSKDYAKFLKTKLINWDIETWLKNWQTMYSDAKIYDINEIAETQSQRNFSMIIHFKKLNFADIHLINLKYESDVYELIEKFRQFSRIHQIARSFKKCHSVAFSISDTFTLNDQASLVKRCSCELHHRFVKCYYLKSII
jgi:hypothetical protein